MINLKNLIDFLPFEFKDQDTYKVNGKGILERFLEICGSYFQDDITSDIDNILELIEVDKVQEKYLNYLWEFFGELPFAKTGASDGVPNLSDKPIRSLIKYSIPLLKIRGSRQFFEILFDLYGLTCTIVDPTDGDMDKWEMVNPIFDTEYSKYDKYKYDKIYGCAQCIQVDITIGGHGFTSPTPEFKFFKQSIDRLFDRFLPYNVSGNIGYGFDLGYNYQIVAEPLIPPTLIIGHITEIPIKVTVTSDYDDADLRYQVTGYNPSENKWSSKKYESGSIFYAKKGDQRYYFRSVGDNSVTTYVDINIDYYTKSYHIYLDLVSGGSNLDNLVITGSNPKIEIKATANRNYKGAISPVAVQLLNTHETKPSGSVWEITSAGLYEFVIAEFPSKKVILKVTSVATTYRVICDPRNINISRKAITRITITSSDPNEDTSNLEAVLIDDPSVVVRNGHFWPPYGILDPINPVPVGTFLFKCTKDISNNPANYGTVVTYKAGRMISYSIGVSDSNLSLNSQGNASTLVYLSSGIYYTAIKGDSELMALFNTEVSVYKKGTSNDWVKLRTVQLTTEYIPGPNYNYGVSLEYQFTEAGTYKFESVGDPNRTVEVTVSTYIASERSYLWLEPLNAKDENWYELKPSSGDSPTKYTTAGYQLTKKSNCQFYLRYGNNGSAPVITLEGSEETYKSDILITFDKPGVYEFYYSGSTVTLTVKEIVPKYSIILEPPQATLNEKVSEVSTIVTCTSDTGDASDIIYETIPDVAHTSPYQFFTNVPGKHTFYAKENPAVKAVFLVNVPDIVDKTELVWEADDTTEQEVKLTIPDGAAWNIKME